MSLKFSWVWACAHVCDGAQNTKMIKDVLRRQWKIGAAVDNLTAPLHHLLCHLLSDCLMSKHKH